jgi:hypothetical protein
MAYKKIKKQNALQKRSTCLKGIKRGPRTVEMTLVAERRKAVEELSAQGMTINSIALALGTTFEVVAQDRTRIRRAKSDVQGNAEASKA